MLQEQEQQMEIPTKSPDAIVTQHSILSSYIIKPDELNIEDDLIEEYRHFREKLVRLSLWMRVKSKLRNGCAFTMDILRQLWSQVVPEGIRGDVNQDRVLQSSLSNDKDASLFEDFLQKKSRFFWIVLDNHCSEENVSEAFEKSSFIVNEGGAIRVAEFNRRSNCSEWKIQGWTKLKNYSILFFKYDMFGHLRNFGHLSKQLLDAYQDDENFLNNFKNQLEESYERFEAMEKQFVNSYLEKQDRMHFE